MNMTAEAERGHHILRTEVTGDCKPDVYSENLALLKEEQVLFFVEPLLLPGAKIWEKYYANQRLYICLGVYMYSREYVHVYTYMFIMKWSYM